jgi:hypothetical protein
VKGAFGCPTVVNNVETLCAVPWIMEHGGEAYAKIGTEKFAGHEGHLGLGAREEARQLPKSRSATGSRISSTTSAAACRTVIA